MRAGASRRSVGVNIRLYRQRAAPRTSKAVYNMEPRVLIQGPFVYWFYRPSLPRPAVAPIAPSIFKRRDIATARDMTGEGGTLLFLSLAVSIYCAYADPIRIVRSRGYETYEQSDDSDIIALRTPRRIWSQAAIYLSPRLPPPEGVPPLLAISLKWSRANYTFLYFSDSLHGGLVGSLLYMRDYDMRRILAFSRPKSRLLLSGNIIEYRTSASVPSNSYLSMPIPRSDAMVHGYGGDLGATFAGDPPKPSATNPPKKFGDVTREDLIRMESTFILTYTAFGGGTQTCFIDPMATIAPRRFRLLRTMRFGSDRAEVIMKFGVDFASLLISMRYSSPIELILVKKASRAAILWPSLSSVEPAHSQPNTAFKTYVLGPAENPSGGDFKIMVDMASAADESLDRLFQSSQAHLTMLTFASNTPLFVDDSYFFRLVITRVWMTMFSAIQRAFKIASISLDELLSVEADVKLLVESIFKLALKGNPETFFIQSNSPITGNHATHLEDILVDLMREICRESPNAPIGIEQKREALRLAYILGSSNEGTGSLGDMASTVSLKLIEALHDETMFAIREWNNTARHAAFYAITALLRASPNNREGIRDARRTLLLTTSMCTEEHIAKNQLTVQTIYIHVSTKVGPFSILDTYSPCSTSMRGDLDDYAHRVHAMASVAGFQELRTYLAKAPEGGPAAEEMLAGKGYNVMTKWHDSIKTFAKLYVPEVVSCPGTEDSLHTALLILPVGPTSSYVLTRKPGPKGITYRLDGVSINNPLFLTFVIGGTCISTTENIKPVTLPRPTGYQSCPYCGCVVIGYTHGGTVRHSIYVTNLKLQNELFAGVNSSVRYFNPSDSAGRGTTLLLFPNGTVVRVVALEGETVLVISGTYIAMAVTGSLLAVIVILVTLRMIINYCRDSRYETLLSRSF